MSKKKRNKQASLPPAPVNQLSTNSYGIDHSFSGSSAGASNVAEEENHNEPTVDPAPLEDVNVSETGRREQASGGRTTQVQSSEESANQEQPPLDSATQEPASHEQTSNHRRGDSVAQTSNTEGATEDNSAAQSKDPELGSVKDKLSQFGILMASIPDEPDPAYLFGRNLKYMSTLSLPMAANCEHRLKPSLLVEPPPDIVESLNAPEEVNSQEASMTERCEEAYIRSFDISCWLGDTNSAYELCHEVHDIYQEEQKRDPTSETHDVDTDDRNKLDSLDGKARDGKCSSSRSIDLQQGNRKRWMHLISKRERTEEKRKQANQHIDHPENAVSHDEAIVRTNVRMPPHPSLVALSPPEDEDTAENEERRDSAAVKGSVSPLPPTEWHDQPLEGVEIDSKYQDLEWTSQSQFYDADSDTSPTPSEITVVRCNDDRDNASISTTSSDRNRLTLRRDRNSRQWTPFQSKSTASIGISADHSAMGKLSLREAVSPTRKGRRSVAESDMSNLLARNCNDSERNDRSETTRVGDSPERHSQLLRESAIECNDFDPGSPPYDRRRAQLRPYDIRKKKKKKVRDLHTPSSTLPPPSPDPLPDKTLQENTWPAVLTKRHIYFADPIASVHQHNPSQALAGEYTRPRKHKRSSAVDLTAAHIASVREQTRGESS
jgi:hypothetical protein